MKKTLISILSLSIIASMIVGTISYFGDNEDSTDNIFSAGIIDLEVNGENPLNHSVIVLEKIHPYKIYYQNISLHLEENSNSAKIWMHVFNISDSCSGEYGMVNVSRSDNSTVLYAYEANSTCIKFEESILPLGEDNTIGLTDTFVVTSCEGTLPISGEIKTGAGKVEFIINFIGEEINVYYYDVITYKIRLINESDGVFIFEVESIDKPGNTGMSHIIFCFSCCNKDLSEAIEIALSITNTSSNETFTIIDFDEHKIIHNLECIYINLTTLEGIPEFMPCIEYILKISIHLNSICCCESITFDIEFYAEHKGGAGFSDVEISIGNLISREGE